MLDLNQFVKNAIKTESKIDKVKVNRELLTQTISILINAGNILDQIKKQAFYNKPYNLGALTENLIVINEASNELSEIRLINFVNNETELNVNPRIFHSIVGISTEATELLEALDIDSSEVDKINIGEELGDLDWYKAIAVDEIGIEWENILNAVIKKLETRYPNKFNSEDAINRNLDKEREVLNEMEIK